MISGSSVSLAGWLPTRMIGNWLAATEHSFDFRDVSLDAGATIDVRFGDFVALANRPHQQRDQNVGVQFCML
jgi:hypothetical protein